RQGSSARRPGRVVELGMTPPAGALWVWSLVPDSSLTQSRARSWFLDLAAMPRSEPPRNTGAVCPLDWLGSGEAARSFSRLGLPCLGSRMEPFSQALATIMARGLWAKAWSCLSSSPCLSAREQQSTSCLSAARPAWASVLSRVPRHWPPSCTATSPPRSQMNGRAAYQYLPGKEKAENRLSSPKGDISFWARDGRRS